MDNVLITHGLVREKLEAYSSTLNLCESLSLRRLQNNVEAWRAAEALYKVYVTDLLENERTVLQNVFAPEGSSLTELAEQMDLSKPRLSAIFKRGVRRLVELSQNELSQAKLNRELEPQANQSETTELATYEGNSVERAFDWSKLSDEERRLRAVKLASERDFEGLWSLTAAHLILFGDKGAKVSPRTTKSYRQGLKDLLRDWGGVSLIRPSTNAGVEWIRTLETQPMLSKCTGEPLRDKRTGELRVYAPATVALKLAGARAFYRALRWSGATKATPFVDVKPAKDSVHAWDKREAYTSEEINRLVEIAEGPDLALVLLGAHAGLRISEATHLRWADVMLESRTLRVVQGKGGKTATAVMSGRLQEALAALERGEPQDFVLPYRTYRARERFYALCQRAGVRYEGREFHGTRHHAGVQAYKQFGTFDRVAEHLRQADVNQGKRYGYMADETLKDGVKDW